MCRVPGITFKTLGFALFATLMALPPAMAAQCGNTSAGFNNWVGQAKKEAAAKGFNQRTINATLGNVSYSRKTINADRNQKSFKLSLNQFMKKRGAATIVRQGKQLKAKNQKLFASLERRYGVPPGPLLAIWGMETGFGRFMGNSDTISSVRSTLGNCSNSFLRFSNS